MRVTSDALQSTKCRACHAKGTGRAAETKGRQGVHPTPCRALSATPATQKPPETKGRQGVHPTPCRAPNAAPATQKPPAEQRRPRDSRAYIRPLADHQVLRLPRKSHRQRSGDQVRPGRTSYPLQSTKCRACHAKVHPTPCRAPSAAPATQKTPAERQRPRDARAYIRPLAGHQVPRLPRKSHGQSNGDQGIRPLAEHQVLRLPRKSHRQSSRDQGTPGRTVGVMHAELQSRLSIYPSIYLSLSLYLSIYQIPCSCACRFHKIATSLCIRKNKRLKLTVLVHDQKAFSEEAHPGASFREETAEG